jgi:hypothetical protein
MGHAIGITLPVMTGIMISPIPMAGLIVVLTSKRGPAKSIAFGLGFFGSLWVATFLLALAGQSMIPASGTGGAGSSWGTLIHGGLGVFLLALGSVVLIKHLRRKSPATEPRWMKTIDSASMQMVFVAGGCLLFLNPKNLPLVISAVADYAQASLGAVQLAVVVTVFALVGSLLIFLPIVLVHLARERSAKVFAKVRPWLIAHNAAILAVVCVVVGAAMLGKALMAPV